MTDGKKMIQKSLGTKTLSDSAVSIVAFLFIHVRWSLSLKAPSIEKAKKSLAGILQVGLPERWCCDTALASVDEIDGDSPN